MKHVTFQEYEAAKAEILLGVQYKEDHAERQRHSQDLLHKGRRRVL